ncbi:MAG: DUF494 domain-containing protein [Calditrichaeota bacterium]|nr:DUF494 domain-containing protein [Calditrichota bacterium]
MQEKLIEIIVYLLQELNRPESKGNYSNLSQKLLSRGYSENEINLAFTWIFNRFPEKTSLPEEDLEYSKRSNRVLHEVEKMVIDPNAYGYLLQMKQLALLDDYEFEMVIEKALTIGTPTITIEDIKIIAASVIFDNDVGNQSSWNGFLFPFGSNTIH